MFDFKKYDEIMKPIADAIGVVCSKHYDVFGMAMQDLGWDANLDDDRFTKTFDKYICTCHILFGDHNTILSDPAPSRMSYIVTIEVLKKRRKSQEHLSIDCFVWIPNPLAPADAIQFAEKVNHCAKAKVEEAISPTPEE